MALNVFNVRLKLFLKFLGCRFGWRVGGLSVLLPFAPFFPCVEAAAGALLGPVYVISPQMGNIASLKSFAIVILGGLGSISGATIGGFVLAFAEEMGAAAAFLASRLGPAKIVVAPLSAR